ncbi:hypothetical protein [Nonomuraea sp. NPDC005650]|uniref:hypothetical protein n=1 Tax=Nonomuraea sp. NPDC005650 TaxID=3157045 RepID=UPI0033ABEC53
MAEGTPPSANDKGDPDLGRLLARLDGDAFDIANCGHPASLATTDRRPSGRSELAALAVDLDRLIDWTNITAAADHYRSHPADGLQQLGFTT